jgi:hypothetical protein
MLVAFGQRELRVVGRAATMERREAAVRVMECIMAGVVVVGGSCGCWLDFDCG